MLPPKPSKGARTALPISAPTMPTMMFQRMPIEASRRMTMLANQPATPPTIIAMIQPITGPPVRRTSCAYALQTERTQMRSPGSGPQLGRWEPSYCECGEKEESILELTLVKIAVVLNPRHPQSLHARTIHRALPAGKLLEREIVALEHFVDGQQAAVDRGDDLCLAADHPALGIRRGQVGEGQRLTKRPDHLRGADFLVLDHLVPRHAGCIAMHGRGGNARMAFAIA